MLRADTNPGGSSAPERRVGIEEDVCFAGVGYGTGPSALPGTQRMKRDRCSLTSADNDHCGRARAPGSPVPAECRGDTRYATNRSSVLARPRGTAGCRREYVASLCREFCRETCRNDPARGDTRRCRTSDLSRSNGTRRHLPTWSGPTLNPLVQGSSPWGHRIIVRGGHDCAEAAVHPGCAGWVGQRHWENAVPRLSPAGQRTRARCRPDLGSSIPTRRSCP